MFVSLQIDLQHCTNYSDDMHSARSSSVASEDLDDEDIAGSGAAIQSYTVHRALGGAVALDRLDSVCMQRGLRVK